MRSWPSSARCAAAARAPPRSSIPTNGTPATRGVSAITTGTLRSSAASTPGWPSGSEMMQNASTIAARTAVGGRAAAAGERRGEQHERRRGALGLGGDAAEGGDRGRVLERVGEPFREHHADRAGAAGAQGPPGRVGPCVAELGGEGEHALAQRRVELVGAVERVRRGGARDPEPVGQGLERHPAAVSHPGEATARRAADRGVGERRAGERAAAGDVEQCEGGDDHGRSLSGSIKSVSIQ